MLERSQGRFRQVRNETESQCNIAARAAAQVKNPPDGDQAVGKNHVSASLPKAWLPEGLVKETEVKNIAASGDPHETTQIQIRAKLGMHRQLELFPRECGRGMGGRQWRMVNSGGAIDHVVSSEIYRRPSGAIRPIALFAERGRRRG